MKQKYLTAATSFAENLADDNTAADYLEGRAIDPNQAAEALLIGSVPDGYPGFEQFAGMISFPYVTRAGVVSWKFRHPDDDHKPKCLGMPGIEPLPYNVRDLSREEDFIVLCEGEPDTATVHLAGLPAVGLPGVSSWRPLWRRLFTGYRRVLFLAHNDKESQGLDFANKVAKEVRNTTVILLDDDANQFAQDNGLGGLREKITSVLTR